MHNGWSKMFWMVVKCVVVVLSSSISKCRKVYKEKEIAQRELR